LGIGDWGLGVCAQNPNPTTQNPTPKTPTVEKIKNNKFFNKN